MESKRTAAPRRMKSVPPPEASFGAAEGAVGAGTICLDLVATVQDWTLEPIELVVTADDLARWFDLIGLPAPVGGLTEDDLGQARTLRGAVNEVARALVNGRPVGKGAVRTINTFAQHATPVFLLRPSGRDRATVEELDATASLAVVARDAVHLFTGPDLGRLRECDGCASLFFDRSPSGRRRWCSMRRCGERAASASYRRRRAEQGVPPTGPTGPGDQSV